VYPTNVIPETRRVHEILYLRFYYAYNEIGYDVVGFFQSKNIFVVFATIWYNIYLSNMKYQF
jgi:hypothetical protein